MFVICLSCSPCPNTPQTHHSNDANDANETNRDDRPACAICRVRRHAPLVVRKGYQVVRCRLCGLVYVSPRPRQRHELDALYTNARYSTRQVAHVLHEGRTREAQWRLDQLESSAGRRGTLLDVGCSAGSFLLAARERGWDVHGIDVSPDAVRHASTALDLDARVATLEDAPFPPRSFDAITIFECIEHMLQPGDALQAAWRLLKDDGVLLITTPNIDGFVPRATYLLLGRDDWRVGASHSAAPPLSVLAADARSAAAPDAISYRELCHAADGPALHGQAARERRRGSVAEASPSDTRPRARTHEPGAGAQATRPIAPHSRTTDILVNTARRPQPSSTCRVCLLLGADEPALRGAGADAGPRRFDGRGREKSRADALSSVHEIVETPPMCGRRASGMTTDPSACW